jgi:hypothetical protein
MSPTKKILVAISIFAVIALACGMSVDLGTTPAATATAGSSGINQVATVVAQTLQAYTQQAPTATASPTLTGTPAPTGMPPTLTVSADTICYAGPGANYGMVITLHPGTIAVVIGKNSAANYWAIETPNYPGSTCWLSGQYATISGDASSLPEGTPAAVNTYTLSEPRSLNISCSSQPITSDDHHDHDWGDWGDWDHNNSADWTVDFRWKNTEPNAYAVYVYRNGRLIATLGAHGSSFTDEFRHEQHRTVTYGVQAVRGSEVSSIVTIDIRHCPGD